MAAARRLARWLLGLAALSSGCAFGPKALERTHGRYNEAVRHVEEEQVLRNIVHLRYNEAPLNLDVNSITTQYELAAQAEARPFFAAPNPPSERVIPTFSRILPDLVTSASQRPTSGSSRPAGARRSPSTRALPRPACAAPPIFSGRGRMACSGTS